MRSPLMRTLLLFLLVSCAFCLKAQPDFPLPDTRDSLSKYIEAQRSKGKKDIEFFKALYKMSNMLMYEEMSLALSYATEAAQIAEDLDSTIRLANASFTIGYIYQHWGYAYAAAEYFQKSYMLQEKVGMGDYAGYDLLSIGNVYHDLQKWNTALEYYYRSLICFKRVGDQGGLPVAFNNIGIVLLYKGQCDSALSYFQKALVERRIQADSLLVGHTMGYMIRAYTCMGRYKEALTIGRDALYKFNHYQYQEQHLGLQHMPTYLHYQLGEVFLGLQQIDSAIVHWKIAIEQGKHRPKLTKYYLRAFGSLGVVMAQKGQTAAAIALLEEALLYADTLQITAEKEDLLLKIATIHENIGNYAKANEYLHDYQLLLKGEALGASDKMLNFHAIFETYEQQRTMQQQKMLLENEKNEKKQQLLLNRLYLFLLAFSLFTIIFVLNLYQKIRRINRTIEQRNAEITHQNSIIEANAQVMSQLNETKDLLFSIIAHDLRAPFNTLTNFSKIMQTYIENSQWQELKASFEALDETSKAAYFTFENLLGWVQSQTGKLQPKLEDINISHLVKEVLGLLKSSLMMQKIDVNVNIKNKMVKADHYMLLTIFRNLISNAIKYSKDGDSIEINAEKNSEATVLISIKDFGAGISETAQKTIFDPKYLRSSSQSVSGLGLLICKNFVDTMGGNIWVESIDEDGTTFFIELPVGNIDAEFNKIGKLNSNEADYSLKNASKIPQNLVLARSVLIEYLGPFAPELIGYSVYEASEIKRVIQNVSLNQSLPKEVNEWLSFLSKAVYISDSAIYEELIALIYHDSTNHT